MSINDEVSESFRIRETPPGRPSIKLPVSITEVVYQTLRQEISHGIFGPGQIHLKQLADRFGVSAVPVREALRRLEAEGLVSFGSNRRITINRLTQMNLNEIFTIRIEIEALAVRHAVKCLCSMPGEITSLKQLLRQMDKQESSPADWQSGNERFHKMIYSFAHMPRLESIVGSLWATSEPYIRLYIRSVHSFRESQEEHKAMLQQIEARDGEGAAATLRKHLAGTLSVLRGRIAEDERSLSKAEVSN
jgi:DNA-binding GntR family transcriptional regulator